MPGDDFDILIATLRGLTGRDIEFHMSQPSVTEGSADGFHGGEPVFGLVSLLGRLAEVRWSSRENERWHLVIDAVPQPEGYVTVALDRQGVEWVELGSTSVAFGQLGLIYSAHWS